MKVKIFTEGGNNIGLGHISRCSSLYDEIKKYDMDVEFIICGDIKDINFLKGKRVLNLDWLSEEFLNIYIETTDYCIVDSYLAAADLYQIIANKSKKALYIDDNARVEYPKGIIVNPSLNVDGLYYPENIGNTYLLGSRYVILRSAFVNVSREAINKDVKEVLVTIGGSDCGSLLEEIINKIGIDHKEITFNIVSGDKFQSQNAEGIIETNIKFHYNIDAEAMKKLMLKSDIAITAAGQTIYELLATQTPFIPIKIIDNQNNNISGLIEKNPKQVVIGYNDEDYIYKLEDEFLSMLNLEIRKSFVKRYLNCIDGFGSKRIIEKLIFV